jgi:Peptidase propeptide and YPEB domain
LSFALFARAIYAKAELQIVHCCCQPSRSQPCHVRQSAHIRLAFPVPCRSTSGRAREAGIAEARAIALKAHPGKITDEELERESGGTGLRYLFDIKSGSAATHEVGVDAKIGRVLENAKEGKNPD